MNARDLHLLADRLQGDLLVDDLTHTAYSTDAAEYQERPLAIARPLCPCGRRRTPPAAALRPSFAGRLRGEFIRTMVGDGCHRLLERVKRAFDPQGIFNPGKIVATSPISCPRRGSTGIAITGYCAPSTLKQLFCRRLGVSPSPATWRRCGDLAPGGGQRL